MLGVYSSSAPTGVRDRALIAVTCEAALRAAEAHPVGCVSLGLNALAATISTPLGAPVIAAIG